MLNRRHALSLLALTGAVFSFGRFAIAADAQPFNQAVFDSAQAAGKPILIHVTAPWCPNCRAQAPILARLRDEARFKDMVSMNIDFDSQKDLLRKFNVQKQSTLIVYSGRTEKGRSTGDTQARAIETLVAKAV